MKHLLMIIPFFPPAAGGGVYRALSFVRYLEGYGWRPTVVAPDGYAYWIVDESLLDDIPGSCDVHRTRTLSGQYVLRRLRGGSRGGSPVRSSRSFRILRRLGAALLVPDTYVGWYPFARRVADRLVRQRRFDAVFSTSPPETGHMVALHIHKSSGLPWVADFRDPWTNLYVLPPASRFHARVHDSLEKKVCTSAWVVVTNREHKEQLEAKYPGMNPPRVIPNGYDHAKLEAYADLRPSGDRCRILHAGTLSEKRSAAAFLSGLKIFLDGDPGAAHRVQVMFVGPREDENDVMVRRLGLEDVVEFRDTVPHGESLKLVHTSHVLLMIALEHRIPGKFFEYVGARRPILALAAEGELKDLVVRLRRGEVAPADDPRRIAEAIGRLVGRFTAGTLDRDYDLSVVAEYRRDRLTADLAQCLDGLVNRGATT
jgi:glycosyltransferase involved in cell wall biosynthesis